MAAARSRTEKTQEKIPPLPLSFFLLASLSRHLFNDLRERKDGIDLSTAAGKISRMSREEESITAIARATALTRPTVYAYLP